MAKKEFNLDAVEKQIADLDSKIQKLTLVKQQLELSREDYLRKLDRISSESNK